MDKLIRILIVEDDMIIAANLSLQLTKLGYEVIGIVSRGEDAISSANQNKPDIILMDINLKGAIDGIDAAIAIHLQNEIPIIYLTANNDDGTFSRAKETQPYAFISKPFNKLNLQRTIALVVEQLKDNGSLKQNQVQSNLQVLPDRIFVRHNGRMVKILLDQILYIEAERNYCNITTALGKYLVVSTLKTIENELKDSCFIRVHRSYIVNICKLDVVADSHLEIDRKVIPISKSYKEFLLGRLHTI
ncbi:MAG: response regulator [Eudoraea sp.]|uniref:LytR/AlgR family response regulator transcription factor n=1 Tax=Eudoraea sp. TaxID=1979955 RepID=UPI003C79044D